MTVSIANLQTMPSLRTNIDGHILDYNPAFLDFYRVQSHEVSDLRWNLFYDVPSWMQRQRAVYKLLKTGQPQRFRAQQRRQENPLLVTLTPTSGTSTEFQEYIQVMPMPTSSVSEAYLTTMMNTSLDAIVGRDLAGTIQSWNPAATALFGYTASEMMGQTVETIVPLDKQPEMNHYLAVMRTSLALHSFETERLKKNGERVPVHITMAPVLDSRHQLQGIVSHIRDITPSRKAERTIWHQANFDSLTGLPNARLLEDRALQVIPECIRREEKVAVLHVNLDHFKDINDEHGVAVGDAVLKETALRLKRIVREQDTIARRSGNDFILLINGFDYTSPVEQFVERVQDAFKTPVLAGGHSFHVSISIGVAVCPDDSTSWAGLSGQAEIALFAAKSSGRSRVQYFTQELRIQSVRRRFILNEFQRAVSAPINELSMHYQPIVCMNTMKMVKAEALTRWNHPTGNIAPMDFIPIIEQSDMVHAFGDFVVTHVATDAQALRNIYGEQFTVAFNLSPAQLRVPRTLATHWASLLQDQNLSTRCLVAEITEGMIVDNASNTQRNLESLGLANIGIAIDDFGTGYSSLNYLARINADIVKIDQSFVRHIDTETRTKILCEAIIAVAHKLGMAVVAEGIETQEQWNILQAMGCDMGQGFYIAKPMPLQTLIDTWPAPQETAGKTT